MLTVDDDLMSHSPQDVRPCAPHDAAVIAAVRRKNFWREKHFWSKKVSDF